MYFLIIVKVLDRKGSIYDVYKASKRPKRYRNTKKAATTYKEPTQSTNSNNDKELFPMYNLTHSQKRFKKELLIFGPSFHNF